MYQPLAPEEVADLLEREVGGRDWLVELISHSSNYIYRCTSGERVVAVRAPRVSMDAPSSFWRQMREVFALTFPPSESQLRAIAEVVTEAGLPCPRVLAVASLESRPIVVTTWVAGEPWKPDQFPPSLEAHRSLGEFLARMHEQTHDGFGSVRRSLRPTAEYYAASIASARTTAHAAWNDGSETLLAVMDSCEPTAVASSCSMVMPDISGNQFLYGDTGISAVVDLDGYVVGPIELELTIAEWCLVDHGAFADGYRRVRPLPTFSAFRAFHRATMLINEEALSGDVHKLLDQNAYFD